MKAYRLIDDTGAIWAVDFEVRPGGVWIDAMGRVGEGEGKPGPGTPTFRQIEENRPQGRVVVALVFGPRHRDYHEPDWANCVVARVLNPRHPSSYGGWESFVTYTSKVYGRRRART